MPEFPSKFKSVIWHIVSSMRGDELLVRYNIQPDYIKFYTDSFDFSVIKSLSGYLGSAKLLIQFELHIDLHKLQVTNLKMLLGFLIPHNIKSL